MKIEKGKLYYDTERNIVFKANSSSPNYSSWATNKIAVHCPKKEDWDYVVSKGYNLFYKHIHPNQDNICFGLYSERWSVLEHYESSSYQVITIDKFKEFYPPKDATTPNSANSNRSTKSSYRRFRKIKRKNS